jgi:hypothetical protein
VGEKDAQPVTAEKENKNMKFSSNNNGNSGSGGQKEIRRQQTTTQQIIAENVKHLIEQLEQGKSEALTSSQKALTKASCAKSVPTPTALYIIQRRRRYQPTMEHSRPRRRNSGAKKQSPRQRVFAC